jgi:transposase
VQKQDSRLDFSGQRVEVGLDVDNKHWDVCIRVGGVEHRTFHQPPAVEPLVKYLRRNFPGAHYRCVYEAGCFGFWIHDALRAAGVECMVVSPADVPTSDRERRRRNDRVDARKLARELAGGELRPVYVPRPEALQARSLVRARWWLVKKRTRCKNQIKSTLSFYGVQIPAEFAGRRWSRAFVEWLEQVQFQQPSGHWALDALVQELQYLDGLLARVTDQVGALAEQKPHRSQVQLLTTIPGIGELTAMVLLTEIIDVERFRNLDHLASYVGLVPGEDSSGDREWVTGLTQRRNAHLRRCLIEASWVAVRKDPALLQRFTRLTQRMSKTRAIIRIARNLLSRIRYVLKHQEPYRLRVVQ